MQNHRAQRSIPKRPRRLFESNPFGLCKRRHVGRNHLEADSERAGEFAHLIDVVARFWPHLVIDVTDDHPPTAELSTDDPDLRLCLILACDVGTTTVFSCSGGAEDSAGPSVVAARTEGGFRGCCRTGAGKISAGVQCSGFPLRGHAVQGFLWIDSNAGGDGADHDYVVRYQMR